MSGAMTMPGMAGGPPMMGMQPGIGGAGGAMPMPQQGMQGGGQPMANPAAGGVQGLPPQLLAMLQQRMGQAPNGIMGQGGPMQGAVVPSQAPTPGMGAPGVGPAPAMGGSAPAPGMAGTAAQMAQHGRFGDKVLAHMAPGEMAIPPEMQMMNPQLMLQIQKAFAQMGLSPAQFTAGSPQGVKNPLTGLQENSLLGALLPILGAVGGSMIAPGIGTAIGGGLGGVAGGMVDKSGLAGSLAQGAGGALGGYLGGGGLGGAANAGAATAALPPGVSGPVAASSDFTGTSPFGSLMRGGLGAGLGSAVGGILSPPQQGAASQLPPGFNTPRAPVNPQFNSLLGNGQSSSLNTAGYNPYAVASGSPYNFYGASGAGY